ncbi:MAG: hypothetical protein WA738_17540 [Candidatus Angelobacter sp.]
MRFRLAALLFLALAAPLCLAYQAAQPALQLRELHPTAESKAAQDQALHARKQLLMVNENAQKILLTAEANHSPEVQAQAAEAQKQVAVAQQAAAEADTKAQQVQATVISPQDWRQMQSVLQDQRSRYESSMKHYSAMATGLVLAGILMAASAALAGFLRKSIAAGIISILVTAVVGIPKVFPISQRAEYYRALFGQSSTLLVQSQLRLNPTEADYNEFVRDIQVLSEYETDKFPSSGDVAANTENLIKDIAASGTK